MKKITLLLFGLLLFGNNMFAQNERDSVHTEEGINLHFFQNNEKLSSWDMLRVTRNNPEAHAEMKIAQNFKGYAGILSFTGTLFAALPVGSIIINKEPNWNIALIGGGLIVASVPLYRIYKKHAKKSVEIYNSGLENPTSLHNTGLKFNVGPSGIGLVLQF